MITIIQHPESQQPRAGSGPTMDRIRMVPQKFLRSMVEPKAQEATTMMTTNTQRKPSRARRSARGGE